MVFAITYRAASTLCNPYSALINRSRPARCTSQLAPDNGDSHSPTGRTTCLGSSPWISNCKKVQAPSLYQRRSLSASRTGRTDFAESSIDAGQVKN
jgi:hypothetical protein